MGNKWVRESEKRYRKRKKVLLIREKEEEDIKDLGTYFSKSKNLSVVVVSPKIHLGRVE